MSTQPEQLLKHIAAIVHCGGLTGISDSRCEVLIRKLTLGYFDGSGGTVAMKARVVDAMLAANEKGQE